MTDWIAGFSSAGLTLLIVAIAIVPVGIGGFALAREALYRDFVTSAARFKAAAGAQDDALVTEEDLRELPEPMARYMRFSGVLGRKRISAVHLFHSGQFKPGADRQWMPIDGEYFITTKKPSFFWYGKVNILPGISFIALDSYAGGSGRMVVKLMSSTDACCLRGWTASGTCRKAICTMSVSTSTASNLSRGPETTVCM